MKYILESKKLWIFLSIFTFLCGLVALLYKFKYFNLVVAGILLIVYGSILCLIAHLNAPPPGAMSGIARDLEGNEVLLIPGEEYRNHTTCGIVLIIIGTLLGVTSLLVV